ncbi:MAG: thiamine phosphate synthase [Vicinamibacterales bacterium]
MTWPPLYAVLDVETCAREGRDPLAVADALVEAGVTLLQVRAKAMPSGAFLALSSTVVARAGTRARVIINDRADIARLSGAAGVHVGQDDLAVEDVRRLVGTAAIVGVSTHSVAQAEAALRQPISYLAVGPVFGTSTKDTGYAAVGLELVSAVARLAEGAEVPVVAIGGITLERAPDVLAAGASSVCVISDLLRGDPATRVRAYLEALGG